jgi:hypothetical protein
LYFNQLNQNKDNKYLNIKVLISQEFINNCRFLDSLTLGASVKKTTADRYDIV